MGSENNVAPHFLPSNIRTMRKKMGLSQEELAHRLGLNRGNIASYENGSAEPRIAYLIGFSELFGVSVPDLALVDLNAPDHPTPGTSFVKNFDKTDIRQLEQFSTRSNELQSVLDSFNTYHRFKMKSLDALPKELQMMAINFEELFEVSEVLMKSHKELLQLIHQIVNK